VAKRLVTKIFLKIVWLKEGLQPDQLNEDQIQKLLR